MRHKRPTYPVTDPRRWNAYCCIRNGLLMLALAGAAVLFVPSTGCVSDGIRPPDNARRVKIKVVTTGYDSGAESCGWKRNWYGRPVYAYGPMKGKPKKVGQTACGAIASHGTLAADISHYPFGTIFYIPGYGYGIVEDRGGAIKGPNRLDLWFPSRKKALAWGKRTQDVYVWLPKGKELPK